MLHKSNICTVTNICNYWSNIYVIYVLMYININLNNILTFCHRIMTEDQDDLVEVNLLLIINK